MLGGIFVRRVLALILCAVFVISAAVTGCGKTQKTDTVKEKQEQTKVPSISASPTSAVELDDTSVDTIVVYTQTNAVKEMLEEYKKLTPDFKYDFQFVGSSIADVSNDELLGEPLKNGSQTAPDIYCLFNQYECLKFSKGEYADYACAYEDLGLDVNTLLKQGAIEQFTVDLGTRNDGKLVGLGIDGSSGVFMYRRSIAKAVWDTDDPEIIAQKIGGSWKNFLVAAKELKEKGYYALSSGEELWRPMSASASSPWLVNGTLTIDPKRADYFDLLKTMKDSGFTEGKRKVDYDWNAIMEGKDSKKVFGYFVEAPAVEYYATISKNAKDNGTYGDWGVCEPTSGFNTAMNMIFVKKDCKVKKAVGEVIKWMTLDYTGKGLQYLMASRQLPSSGDNPLVVTSSIVMDTVDGTMDFLGGQNIYDVCKKLAGFSEGKVISEYDYMIDYYFGEEAWAYAYGKKSRDNAIEDFKKNVATFLKEKNIE